MRGSGDVSPSMTRLSISNEHVAKRAKLGHRSSSAESMPTLAGPHNDGDSEQSSGEDFEELALSESSSKPLPTAARGKLNFAAPFQAAADSAAQPRMSPPMNTMTSILHTPAAYMTSTSNSEHDEDEDDDEKEEEEEDGEGYEIEAIFAHHMSDPRTHGPDFGRTPIMLYHVKWQGYDSTTWEPIDSFEDRDVIHSYRRKVGLPDVSDESGDVR